MMRWKAKAAIGIAGTILLAWTAMSVYNAGFRAGESKIQAKWDAEVAQMAQAQAAEVNAARIREQELQALISQQQRTHRNEVARINARHAAAIDGLRDRPERPDSGGVPASPGTYIGCTGAGLARPDAEFLARYAADAQQLASGLMVCMSTLDQIRQSRISADR